ncbi:intraflagellar transport protein 22-like [Pelomyxa schiedti]|nr:intraflagellar transport protein 22-like [Pelomyxa schiedti]
MAFNKGDVSVKILVVGATDVGKSTLCNFLASMNRSTPGYNPTLGVRILEFDRDVAPQAKGAMISVWVELWDCSGDKKYEYGWPALMHGTDGIIFVFNPNNAASERELEHWHTRFAAPLKLLDSQCSIFANQRPDSETVDVKATRPRLSKALQRIPLVPLSLQDNPNGVHEAFDSLLVNIVSSKTRS